MDEIKHSPREEPNDPEVQFLYDEMDEIKYSPREEPDDPEVQFLYDAIAEIHKRYLKDIDPYVRRLAIINGQRPPVQFLILREQAEALGLISPKQVVRQFVMTHDIFENYPESFTELNAPRWLTGEDTVPGSTMDMRWFWKQHVLTLEVGETVKMDFRTIKRIA